MTNIDNKTFYWLIGLLEGEGSFMKGPPSQPNSARIALAMTDLDVVEKVANIWNMGVFESGRKRRKSNWNDYKVR